MSAIDEPRVRIARREDCIAVELDGALVMMAVDSDSYYSMNESAAAVWELLEKPRSLDELCMAILADFSVPEAECRSDLQALLGEMDRHRLLTITTA